MRIRISKNQERTYFKVPFDVPADVERLDIGYQYTRYSLTASGNVTTRREINIIDLAVERPDGSFAGASGSNRKEITLSAMDSTPGYARAPIMQGRWQIILGAYHVMDDGVTVAIDIRIIHKTLRRFFGDTHMHTTHSDGALSVQELVTLSKQQGLDFMILTDHNIYPDLHFLPECDALTIIPGMEWTHYQGHAGLYCQTQPIRNPFCVNDAQQAKAKLTEAQAAGATLVLNHPFSEPECGWRFGLDLVDFDAVEVWNGPLMTDSNAACLAWWHEQLCAGKHIPVIGGSDFHRIGVMTLPGLPTTALYAMSREPDDLLHAIRAGHAYVKMTPDAPDIDMHCADSIMGDSIPMGGVVDVSIWGLRGGDVVCRITDRECHTAEMPPDTVRYSETYEVADMRFVRYEVKRKMGGLPSVTVALTNPIYAEVK